MILTCEDSMPLKLPPHVYMVRNRTGRPYFYLEKHRGTERAERRQRLPDDPRAPEFWAEYARLMQLPAPRERTDTVDCLIRAWQASPEWGQMRPKTRVEWERYCRRISGQWGPLQARGLEPRHILAFRDSFGATPASANNLVRCLSAMLAWSVPRGWRNDNPCREIKPLKGGDSWSPWPWEAIVAARTTLEADRPDLWWAAALALYTGQRQADVLAMRWDAISGSIIAVRQEKTSKRLAIPVHRDLATVLEQIPRRAVTVLTSSEARPWTTDGFKATWNKHKPAAARGLVFHGLRKSAVVMLLEAGCTDAEVAAITGQSRDMIEHYARQVNQGRLAAAAVLKWEAATIANPVANRGR